MASFYGDDASKSALVNAYDTLLPTIAPKHKARLDREVGRNISALAAYRDAELVQAYTVFPDRFTGLCLFFEQGTVDIPHHFSLVDRGRCLSDMVRGGEIDPICPADDASADELYLCAAPDSKGSAG